MDQLIEIKDIAQRISTIRGIKVVIDRDLAEFYGVQTKRLNEQVKRNKDRFPPDLVFQLTEAEKAEVVANCDHLQSLKFAKALPYAFTEHGAIMAASVLNSKAAVEISVLIVRAFVQLRHIFIEHAELKREVEALRKQTEERFEVVFTVLDKLISDDDAMCNKIGFIETKKFNALSTQVKTYPGYTGRNPRSGEPVKVKPKKLPFFKCGTDLKKLGGRWKGRGF